MSYYHYYYSSSSEEEEAEQPFCDLCVRSFRTFQALADHRRNSSYHNWCDTCSREFATPAALRGHEQVHWPKVYSCPRPACLAKFSTASALTKHVEQSACFGRPSQPYLVKKVREWETKSGNRNLLTAPRLGWNGSDTTSSTGKYQATRGAWNGRAFECYFCAREFYTLVSLNQHFNSGVHEAKDFRCKHCGFTATWLSGLVAHFESETCGYMSRSQVHAFARRPFEVLAIRS